jgi:uncharacterized membrane protein
MSERSSASLFLRFFAWQGVNVITNPKEWLERYGRSTADRHIRAVRIIGVFFLGVAFVGLFQMIRQFWR